MAGLPKQTGRQTQCRSRGPTKSLNERTPSRRPFWGRGQFRFVKTPQKYFCVWSVSGSESTLTHRSNYSQDHTILGIVLWAFRWGSVRQNDTVCQRVYKLENLKL
jgi:hypothetical protein